MSQWSELPVTQERTAAAWAPEGVAFTCVASHREFYLKNKIKLFLDFYQRLEATSRRRRVSSASTLNHDHDGRPLSWPTPKLAPPPSPGSAPSPLTHISDASAPSSYATYYIYIHHIKQNSTKKRRQVNENLTVICIHVIVEL